MTKYIYHNNMTFWKIGLQRLGGPFTTMKKINDLTQVFRFHGNPSYVSCFVVKALPCIHHFKKIFWVVFIDWNQWWIRVQGEKDS